MRLLVLNANATAAITDIVAAEARRAAAPGTAIDAVTATTGPRFIASRADNVTAAQAALATARARRDVDAVLLAASSDPGVAALRAELPVPVVGMTEAAALTACLLGGRFGMLVFGRPNLAIYRELIEGYGLGDRLAGIELLELPPLAALLDASTDPAAIDGPVLATSRRLIDAHGADVVLLPSAALSPLPRRLQPHLPVPILDGIACGVALAEALVRLRAPPHTVGSR